MTLPAAEAHNKQLGPHRLKACLPHIMQQRPRPDVMEETICQSASRKTGACTSSTHQRARARQPTDCDVTTPPRRSGSGHTEPSTVDTQHDKMRRANPWTCDHQYEHKCIPMSMRTPGLRGVHTHGHANILLIPSSEKSIHATWGRGIAACTSLLHAGRDQDQEWD